MTEIKIYILEKNRNGRNRYLLMAYGEGKLYELVFFNGTWKQAVSQAEVMLNRVSGWIVKANGVSR